MAETDYMSPEVFRQIAEPRMFSVMVALLRLGSASNTREIYLYMEEKSRKFTRILRNLKVPSVKAVAKELEELKEIGIVESKDVPRRQGDQFWYPSHKFLEEYLKLKYDMFDEFVRYKESDKIEDAKELMIQKYGERSCVFYGITCQEDEKNDARKDTTDRN